MTQLMNFQVFSAHFSCVFKLFSLPLPGTCYTASCDVYSFGVVLWEMITRHKPYLSGHRGRSMLPHSFLFQVASGTVYGQASDKGHSWLCTCIYFSMHQPMIYKYKLDVGMTPCQNCRYKKAIFQKPRCRDWVAEDCCMLSILPVYLQFLARCHPTSYFIFNDFYTFH